MSSIWGAIGFTRWPISFCLVVLALFAAWSALRLFGPGATPDRRTKLWLDSVLVWGFLAFLHGLLGWVIGIITIFQAIEAAGGILPTAIAPGAKATLLSTGFGTMVFVLAVLLWWVLQLRWRLLEAASAERQA